MKPSLRTPVSALAAAVALVAVVSVGVAAPARAATTYGKGVSAAEPVKLSDILAKPDAYVGKTVKVEGLVTDVCSKRGCWMRLAGDKEFQTIRIKVQDGVIVFPMTAKGKKAVAEGVLQKFELTKEQAIEQAKHEAEEAGRKFDPASITGPVTLYQIKSTGAVVD